MNQPTRRRSLHPVIALALAVLLLLSGCGGSDEDLQDFLNESGQLDPAAPGPAPVLGFRIIETFPHQTDAFTQGLLIDSGQLFESTGLLGQSSLREVDLTTGNVLQQRDLAPDLFGEGLASRQGTLYQLTLNSGQAIVWDAVNFAPTGTRTIPSPAWGIALTDEDTLAFSDGTSTLRFLDPTTFQEVRRVTVMDDGQEVDRLNELEVINGLVYANRFTTDEIVVIDPATGELAFRVDLTGLIDKQANNLGANDVLNGIAFDNDLRRLYVTGKRWPFLYHIELVL
jgi:glutaminyl-peptide cyclotransferase